MFSGPGAFKRQSVSARGTNCKKEKKVYDMWTGRTIQQVNNRKQREYPTNIQRLQPAPSPPEHKRIRGEGDEERRAAADVRERARRGDQIQEPAQGMRLERTEGVDLG
jgi:hypothetical protein